MNLEPVDVFALRMVFRGDDPLSIAVRKGIEGADVIARSATGVGFFATINMGAALPDSDRAMWEWNFTHRQLLHGGSFICWRTGPAELELEAVSFYGDWPPNFEATDFAQLG
jgi:hypothetical protein